MEGKEFFLGEAATYEKQGLGIVQWYNESDMDEILIRNMNNETREFYESGNATEADVKELLDILSLKKEYGEMNYPSTADFIEKSKKSADSGYFNQARSIFGEGFKGDVDKASPFAQTLHYQGRIQDIINAEKQNEK